MVILGYSGWGSGQLEGEMERDHWILSDLDVDIIFETRYQDGQSVIAGVLFIMQHPHKHIAHHHHHCPISYRTQKFLYLGIGKVCPISTCT